MDGIGQGHRDQNSVGVPPLIDATPRGDPATETTGRGTPHPAAQATRRPPPPGASGHRDSVARTLTLAPLGSSRNNSAISGASMRMHPIDDIVQIVSGIGVPCAPKPT